jgi:hypothetical protein
MAAFKITISKTLNVFLLLLASLLISFVWQQRVAIPYLTSENAVGGDYFNALTYAKFFTQHKPFPSNGWMPFWNGGLPIIGGYPSFFFYLMLPLTQFFDIPTSMELLSIILLLIFFISALLLFWEISRNHLLALIFTGILIITPATYYALTAEGLVVASAMQLFLPLALLFIIRFTKFKLNSMLLAASLLTGLAFIVHPAMAFITVFIPSLLILLFSETGNPESILQTQQLIMWKPTLLRRIKAKFSQVLLFTLVSLSVGSIGLYTLVLQLFLSAESGTCDNLQCWGNYPQHFSWFSSLILPPIIIFLPISLIVILSKKVRPSEFTAPILALLVPIGYISVSWLKLINNLSSAIFPRRLFWAVTLLALVSAAASYKLIRKASAKLSIAVFSLFAIILIAFTIPNIEKLKNFSVSNYLKIPNSIPMRVDHYILPKYQRHPSSEILPDWLPLEDNNWRLDSVRPDFFVWWNTVSQIPATRGYSNAPTKDHLDWLYFLQISTIVSENLDDLPEALIKNRALFILDSLAVRYLQHPSSTLEDPNAGYHPLLLNDKDLITRHQPIREWSYVQLNKNKISPITTPTNASRILVISDQHGFATFNRALSLVNLNSKILMPMKGPQSINKLTNELLNNVDAIVLYKFTGNDWKLIQEYFENGGKIFIDTGSFQNPSLKLPGFLGISSLKKSLSSQWNLTIDPNSKLLLNVNTDKFSPLFFEHAPWTIVTPPSQEALQSWMQPILSQDISPILINGTAGKAEVIFSGFNLPFHIVRYQNFEEAKLFKNILLELTPAPKEIGGFSVQRPNPNTITISADKASGIYFKENYHPGWKAVVNGQKTQIFKAGLDFMYIPISEDLNLQTNHINLSFRGSLATWLLPIYSLIVFALVSAYILITVPTTKLLTFLKKKVFGTIQIWWIKD